MDLRDLIFNTEKKLEAFTKEMKESISHDIDFILKIKEEELQNALSGLRELAALADETTKPLIAQSQHFFLKKWPDPINVGQCHYTDEGAMLSFSCFGYQHNIGKITLREDKKYIMVVAIVEKKE